MIVEITEEEREFLERVCSRALVFSKMGLNTSVIPNNELDYIKIKDLLEKLKNDH